MISLPQPSLGPRRRVPSSISLIVFALAGLSACDGDGTTTMSPKDKDPVPAVPVQPDPSFSGSAEVEQLRRQERQVIQQILERVPFENRPQMAVLLADRSKRLAGTSDPTLAPLLNQLAGIRLALHKDAKERAAREDIARGAAGERVPVLLAMVPTLSDPSARAAVLRRPEDNGIPILLLPESSATVQDLERGLGVAATASEQYGREPAHPVTLTLRRPRASSRDVQNERLVSLLDRLRQAPLKTLEGLGEARTMVVMAQVPKRPSR